MNASPAAPAVERLAPVLIRKVFSIYLLIAIGLTVLQVWLDYRQTYEQVGQELEAAGRAFDPGIRDALWNYQRELVESIAHGMVDGRVILGVRIRDAAGQMRVERLPADARALDVRRHVDLYHTDPQGRRALIGDMELLSSHDVVLARVRYGVVVALLISLVKTAGLWLVVHAWTTRLVARPLGALTRQVAAFDIAHGGAAPHVELTGPRSLELVVLRDAFNDLGERVAADRRALAELAETLEQRVRERTAELIRERDFSLALVRAIPGLFLLVDREGRIVMSNPSARQQLGLAEQDRRCIADFVADEDREAVASAMDAVFAAGESTCEASLRLDGLRVAPHVLVAHRVQVDTAARAIVVAVDISVRRAVEEQMRRMALYDGLTQLPNRLMLHDRLAHSIALAHRRGEGVAILFLDLDGFKAINDSAGHDVGDAVLREVAGRLQRAVRASDTVARYGGDEFVVVLPGVVDAQAAAVVSGKLIEAVSRPIRHGGQDHRVGVSIGISLLPDHAATAAELLEQADAAMYRAKRRGKGCFEFAAHALPPA